MPPRIFLCLHLPKSAVRVAGEVWVSLRIGVLTTSYPRSHDDGAGRFVAGFSAWLSQHVGDVEVLCASDHWPLFYRGGAPGAIRSRPVRSLAYGAAFSLRFWREASRRSAKWDALVSHWTLPCGVIGRLIRRRSVRHLSIAHGSDIRLAKKWYMERPLRLALGSSTDVVYVAHDLTLAGGPGRVQAMGIDSEQFARAKRKLSTGEQFRLLYVGRLSPEKGLDLLLAVLPGDVELSVAGEGPAAAHYRSIARGKNVIFLGQVPHSQLAELYAQHDLLVVPSRADGAPTVVREAMAAGLPVLATAVGGLGELIEHGRTGWLCEPTASALAQAISVLHAQPEFCRQLAEAAAQERDNFDWSRVGPRLWGGDLSSRATGQLTVVRL